MATAKATAAGNPAGNNGGPSPVRKPVKQAPAIHAVPVEHADKPVKPINAKDAAGATRRGPVDQGRARRGEGSARGRHRPVREQIEISTAELVGLLRDGSEGAGRDPADVGSANFERDAEMSLANNAREMLDQSRLALRHIELGTYGSCDNCGQPIGKGRLQAFPRATLCVTCKQREERR